MDDRTRPSDAPATSLWHRIPPKARYRSAFWISLGVSAAVHLVAIALYPSFFSGIPEADRTFGGYIQPFIPQGTEIVNLREMTPEEESEAPPPPEEQPEVERPVLPTPVRPPGIMVEPGPELPGPPAPGLSAAERIRPKADDLRFWAPVDPERVNLSPEEIMQIQLMARIQAANDSAAIAAAEAAKATDWTYTDENGKKWGISPGALHLGDLTLPLPSFGTSVAQMQRAQSRLWAWDEIDRGAATGALRDSWKARDQAIRERMNAQRRPDTTRTGGGGGDTPN